MYKPEIASEIKKLWKSKPNGNGPYYLKSFDQEDVRDTMNYLHQINPSIFEESAIYWNQLADISFNQ